MSGAFLSWVVLRRWAEEKVDVDTHLHREQTAPVT